VMKKAVAYLVPFLEAEKAALSAAGGPDAPAPKPQGKVLLATVKGDVHDIGKNIVGVVLQCNNFDVVDLGVMVPAQKILDTARERSADIVGLSGLITPSLEEMAHVAHEMQRLGMTQPLLIGGATTSRVHTAVKIAPNYGGATVYVPDASRAVSVASNLLSEDLKAAYVAEVAVDYEKIRVQHASKKGPALIALAAARANAFKADWEHYAPTTPALLGRREIRHVDLGLLAGYIDWAPFFQTWELSGPFPAILDDAIVGEAARSVYADAKAMLSRIIEGRWLTANGVIALMPAHSVADDIELYGDELRNRIALTWRNLRQQNVRPQGKPNYSLADFVAPKDSGVEDYVGAFAVTAGLAIEKKLAEFEAKKDDYNAIMLKALADRLAEAFAEWLHAKVRQELWGYARDEKLDAAAMIREEYRGIRPAPGYPACPDHAVKAPLFDLLEATKIGMSVTESNAMLPAASVSGFYIAHPDATYFAVGKIGEDQLTDFARRAGVSADVARSRLAPNL
jgi:5-methyltetrahydrofolate--homocysteine methyltransferase